MPQLEIKMLAKMQDLIFTPNKRYRVARGGRGGGKSIGFADALICRMISERTDAAVCREYQTTIKKSVHQLIVERIKFYNLLPLFEITDTKIVCKHNGGKITYNHLHNNYTEIKGLEGIDICWIFEGHDLQEESWKVLNPTVRRTPRMKREPEFWIEFNPQFEDDFVYKRFVSSPSEDTINVLINYTDNIFCPQDLILLAEQCKAENPEEYAHIWLGNPRNVGGLVYPMFHMEHNVRDISMQRLINSKADFFMGQDPHTTYYPACVWLARAPRGDGSFDYVWYNEFPTRQMMQGSLYYEIRKEKKCTLTLMDRAKMFKVLDNTLDKTYNEIVIRGRSIDTRFAKGAGGGSTTNNTRGIIVEMADPINGGLVFQTPPEFMIDSQRDRIRQLLSFDMLSPKHNLNEPKMYVMPHCENIIDALKLHRFNKDGKDSEDDKRKDFIDAMRITLALEQQNKYIANRLDTTADTSKVPTDLDLMRQYYMGQTFDRPETITTRVTTPLAN